MMRNRVDLGCPPIKKLVQDKHKFECSLCVRIGGLGGPLTPVSIHATIPPATGVQGAGPLGQGSWRGRQFINKRRRRLPQMWKASRQDSNTIPPQSDGLSPCLLDGFPGKATAKTSHSSGESQSQFRRSELCGPASRPFLPWLPFPGSPEALQQSGAASLARLWGQRHLHIQVQQRYRTHRKVARLSKYIT
jgi:hypothetical protein